MRIRTLLLCLRLGLYMHFLAGFPILIGLMLLVICVRDGTAWRAAYGVAGLAYLALGLACEYHTVYRGLYQKQYLRTTRALRRAWSERIARGKMLTPCQRRMLRIAATHAGCRDQADAFLAANPLPWRWIRAARVADRLRRGKHGNAPFALPRCPAPPRARQDLDRQA